MDKAISYDMAVSIINASANYKWKRVYLRKSGGWIHLKYVYALVRFERTMAYVSVTSEQAEIIEKSLGESK